jgi:hypothetical protein
MKIHLVSGDTQFQIISNRSHQSENTSSFISQPQYDAASRCLRQSPVAPRLFHLVLAASRVFVHADLPFACFINGKRTSIFNFMIQVPSFENANPNELFCQSVQSKRPHFRIQRWQVTMSQIPLVPPISTCRHVRHPIGIKLDRSLMTQETSFMVC